MNKKSIALIGLLEILFFVAIGLSCFIAGKAISDNKITAINERNENDQIAIFKEAERREAEAIMIKQYHNREETTEIINALFEMDMRGEIKLNKNAIFLLGEINELNN
jgi:hypothetical protein